MRVALIGDSQSEALWPRVKKLLPPNIEVVLTRTQRGYAESHYRKEDLLPAQLAEARPDLVVIELGGNNATLHTDKYRDAVSWMLDAARNSGASRVLYLGPAAATKEPYASNKTWTRAAQQAFFAERPEIVWMDSFPHTQSGHVDGVHFGPRTYDAWAPQIAKTIEGAATSLPAISVSGSAAPLAAALLVGGSAFIAALWWRFGRSR